MPDRQTVSGWATDHRVLTERDSSEPGPYSCARTPYLVEPMDALGDPECSELLIMKAAQIGYSEFLRNAIGFWIAQDSGPVLIVLPTENDAKEVLDERIGPMVEATPCLAEHITGRKRNISRRRIILDNMEVHVAWSGSPGSLARRAIRYLLIDEADKFGEFSGKEADPISLGKKRLTTFGHRAKVAVGSTPTTRNGHTWKLWESIPTKKHYHLPCPHCGDFQPPNWQQVRWPKDLPGDRHLQAERIELDALAWYECRACEGRIEERHRTAMLGRGVWVAEGQTIDPAGILGGPPVDARRRAYHIPGLLSPWLTYSKLAAEWIAAIGDDALMMDFRNSRLGETYEVQAVSMRSAEFAEKITKGHARGVVPLWAGIILATADTQKDHFVYAIRAHGYGWKSRLIDHGKCFTFAELRQKCLDTPFVWEDPGLAHLFPRYLMIDSGGGAIEGEDRSRTDDVYQFSLTDPTRILASKGLGGRSAGRGNPVRMSSIKYAMHGEEQPVEIGLCVIDVGYFKDILAARIKKPEDAPDAWELHQDVDAEYCRQLASERKIIVREGRAGPSMRWVKVSQHARNEAWDIETMQVALAQLAHVESLDPPEVLAHEREQSRIRSQLPPQPSGMRDAHGRPFDVRHR
ncbi:MAG: phage terminase large subunit family protein [Planctomycetes bacterium]|nr:phage terminase large subunit family protein [Planctomycetota bacterium]